MMGRARASAAVAPTTVEQVQQVVRVAYKFRIPLYAFSKEAGGQAAAAQ
jgi:FAD/FMN-containing dehydrogenase